MCLATDEVSEILSSLGDANCTSGLITFSSISDLFIWKMEILKPVLKFIRVKLDDVKKKKRKENI